MLLIYPKKKVRECMVPRTEIVAIDILSSMDEVKSIFIKTKFSKLLVYKENIDKIVGYIHSFDLFKKPKNFFTFCFVASSVCTRNYECFRFT